MEKSVAKPRTGAAIQSAKVVERRGRIRAALLSTGAHLFAEKGVEAVSVEELIESVGISRRTFYGFFANKYELVGSILTPVLEWGAEELAAIAKRPPREIVPAIVDMYLRLWAERSDALLTIGVAGAEVLPYIEAGHRAFGTAMKASLEKAAAAGELRNGRADYTFKVISRSAIPLLKVYRDHPDMASVYRDSMIALLARARGASGS
jgi:AcrR family transcriptional regulator